MAAGLSAEALTAHLQRGASMIEVITERFIHTNILARQSVKEKTPDSRAYVVLAACLSIA